MTCDLITDSLDYGMKQTFLLSEIGHWGSNLNFTKAKPIAIREIDQTDEAWEKIGEHLRINKYENKYLNVYFNPSPQISHGQ